MATPTPPDLLADVESGAAAFRAALAVDPEFDDARVGLVGCLGNQLFLAGPEQAAVLAELREVGAQRREQRADNPRSLWLAGGTQLFAPPPYGGHPAKAEALYMRGLQAARSEALAAGPRESWVPAWGAPELLMSLAYLHTRTPSIDRDVARAYAEGALAMVPDWHYVADVLLPKIAAMPASP